MTTPADDAAAQAAQVRAALANLRPKVLAILRDGRLHVVEASDGGLGAGRPRMVDAIVRGHQADYVVTYSTLSGWWCSCRPSKGDDGTYRLCAHALAAELVTHAAVPLPAMAGRP